MANLSQKSIRILVATLSMAACSNSIAAEPPEIRPFSLPGPMDSDDGRFESLFDGESLAGWEGDPTYWRVEDGAIVGEVTPETLLSDFNSFLIWQGDPVEDFELRATYRISPLGNSGINYRSEALETPAWTMRGYQFDIDGPQWGAGLSGMLKSAGVKIPSLESPAEVTDPPDVLRVTGQNYDELGRHILALPGQTTSIGEDSMPRVESMIGGADLVGEIENETWNELRIIARGNTLVHILNDRVVSIVTDNDPELSHRQGKIGVQVHVGPPMKVEFREIKMERL